MKHLATILLIGVTTGVTLFVLSSIEPIRDWVQQLTSNRDASASVHSNEHVSPSASVASRQSLPDISAVSVEKTHADSLSDVSPVAPIEHSPLRASSIESPIGDRTVDWEGITLPEPASEVNPVSKVEPKRVDAKATSPAAKLPESNAAPDPGFEKLNDNLSAMGDALAAFNAKLKDRMKH